MNYKIEKVKKYYDKYGSSYDKERNGTYYYSFINEIETAGVLPYCENKRTLEIGCGSGIILDRVNNVADHAVGMDLSVGMLQSCRGKGLNVTEGDATKIPFEDNAFDVVYSFKVLPHIENLSAVVAEVSRVLKSDGIAVLEFYNPRSFKGVTNFLMNSSKLVYLKFHTPADVQEIVGGEFYVVEDFGARILTPFALIHKVPILSDAIKFVEKKLSRTFMKMFSGYYSVVLRKK